MLTPTLRQRRIKNKTENGDYRRVPIGINLFLIHLLSIKTLKNIKKKVEKKGNIGKFPGNLIRLLTNCRYQTVINFTKNYNLTLLVNFKLWWYTAAMTYEEMYKQATALGFTHAQMIENCKAQIQQYERLSREPNDKWALAAKDAKTCLEWLLLVG